MVTNYDGGKNGSGTYQQIINYMPLHTWYCELFLGSGAIFRRKRTADNNILMDMDKSIIQQFKDHYPGTNNNIMVGNAIDFLYYAAPALNYLHSIGQPVLIYLDPPYPFDTRQSKKPLYKFEMDDQAHKKLLVAAGNLNCYVMISSYKNKMYDRYLTGWNVHQFNSVTRTGIRKECIYMNYTKPTVLHDYQYLGADYRERVVVKGAKKRMINKFKRMDPTHRNDMLTDILNLWYPNNNFIDTSEIIASSNKQK